MPLLDGLDAVRWDELSHAYGPATDVPALLRALVDPDGATAELKAAADEHECSVREHVMQILWGNVFHQGTRWQASPAVVPFIAEILRDGPRDAELQAFALSYLHHLACGYPADEYPALIDPATHFADADGVPDDPDDPYDRTRMTAYARDCYQRAAEALPVVAPLVDARDDAVALRAIALLGSFRDPVAAAALRRVVGAHRGRRLAVALVALSRIDGVTARAAAVELIASEDRYLALHAAAAAVLADLARPPEAAVALLLEPLGELCEAATPLTDSLGSLVTRALYKLPEEHHERAAEAIGRALETSAPMGNLSATYLLLSLVLPDGQVPAAAAQLTPTARRAIEAIEQHGAFLMAEGLEYANYQLLMSEWGLPWSRDELRAWLDGRAPSTP